VKVWLSQAVCNMQRSLEALACANEHHDMLLHMVLQQEIDPLSIRLISFFLAIIFLIPIIKWIFRQLKAQVELFLAAANQEDEENGMLEGS